MVLFLNKYVVMKIQNPKVSVIVPIYNVEKYIEKCATSLFEQTLEEIEYIFVNDCTPDNSICVLENVIERYPSRKDNVCIVHHNVNKGLTSARNSGLEIAKGEYIAHCDSDDWVDRDAYKKMYEMAKSHHADVCVCDMNMVFPEGVVCESTPKTTVSKSSYLKSWISNGMTPLWIMISARSLYQNNNLLCPRGVTYCEDFHMTVRLLHYASNIVKVQEPLYYYNRLNVTSLLNERKSSAQAEETKVYVDIIEFFRKEKVDDTYEREMAWRLLKSLQLLCFDNNRYEEFRSLYVGKNKYILSCPPFFCNFKVKVMMLMLSLHMDWCVTFINNLRKLC